jgi:tRNA (guanosine-2'-O-)-methyltransferase
MQRAHIEALIARHGPARVVEVLTPYLTETRRARIEEVLMSRIGSVEVAIEAPSDPHNAAAVVRTCEALGAMTVHVIAAEGDVLHKKRTTQGAYHWVHTRKHADLDGFVEDMRSRRLVLAGACVDADTPLRALPIDRPLCLLFGNEHRGLSDSARAACDERYSIALYGMSESLNLSVSAAISLYDVLGRMRVALGKDGDLDDGALSIERAIGYVRSVDERLLRGLLGES